MQKNIPNNKLCCPIEKIGNLFFSLVDYHNSFFMSNNSNDIIEFYNHFKTEEELIEWMRERPRGVSYIHEVEGNKDIIVVIPTADFEGKYAKTCKDEIFKGLHIIFVESGIGNFYFNYAHNCNVGLNKALEYNPKWIVVSNDDMYKIDDISVLINELSKLDEKEVKTVFTSPSEYHSMVRKIVRRRFIIYELYEIVAILYNILHSSIKTYLSKQNIIKKFGIIYFHSKKDLKSYILYKEILTFIINASFTILSAEYAKKLKGLIFDETYINGVEDWDFSLQFKRDDYSIINYKIGDIIGGSLGQYDIIRQFREFVNFIYFNHKFIKQYFKI